MNSSIASGLTLLIIAILWGVAPALMPLWAALATALILWSMIFRRN